MIQWPLGTDKGRPSGKPHNPGIDGKPGKHVEPGSPGVCRRGGVGIRVLWIVASLFVIAGAVVWLVNNQQKNEERFYRKALEISEYGLMAVLQKLGETPSWVGEVRKTPYEDGWYSANAYRSADGDTVLLKVESVGHFGPVSKKQQCVLRLSIVNRDSVWTRTNAF